jgi:hypothetical protein
MGHLANLSCAHLGNKLLALTTHNVQPESSRLGHCRKLSRHRCVISKQVTESARLMRPWQAGFSVSPYFFVMWQR